MLARVELRLCLIELLLSTVWVFCSAGSMVAANWCVPSCMMIGRHGDVHNGMGNRTMGMSAMACPPPTTPIVVSLATGFAAAVISGFSFAPDSNKAQDTTDISKATASGAYFNPAVTLGMAARFYLPPHRLLTYIASQLIGSVLGALILLGVVGRACVAEAFDASATSTLPFGSRVLMQATVTVLVVLVHLWAHEKAMFMGTPILVGFAYIAASLVGMQVSNEIPNLLRCFGLASVGAGGWEAAAVVAAGSLCGGMAAAFVDALVFEERLWNRQLESSEADVESSE